MLNIERLNLRLPQGFAPRAANIARLVGDELSHSVWNTEAKITTLRLPPLQIQPNASDREVARALSIAIVNSIQGELR